MHWESGEGRLISEGRTVIHSDQIVLRRPSSGANGGWYAYIPDGNGGSAALRRRAHAVLQLDDGRRGWFQVVTRDGGLLCLKSCGSFR